MKPTLELLAVVVFLGALTLGVGTADAKRPRSELSFGFLTHKTSVSFLDYHYALFQTDDHDVSIGVGTLLAYHSSALAWKYYAYRGFADFYSVLAFQYGAGMGTAPAKVIPSVSLGMEFGVFSGNYLNIGVNQWVNTGLMQLNQFRMSDYFILPQASWGWRW